MKTCLTLLAALLLCGCDAKWPDYAGVMGAPQQQPPAQSLTQSSR